MPGRVVLVVDPFADPPRHVRPGSAARTRRQDRLLRASARRRSGLLGSTDAGRDLHAGDQRSRRGVLPPTVPAIPRTARRRHRGTDPRVSPHTSTGKQISTVARRQVRLIIADRGYLVFLLVMPFVLGVLALVVPGKAGLAPTAEYGMPSAARRHHHRCDSPSNATVTGSVGSRRVLHVVGAVGARPGHAVFVERVERQSAGHRQRSGQAGQRDFLPVATFDSGRPAERGVSSFKAKLLFMLYTKGQCSLKSGETKHPEGRMQRKDPPL